MKATRTTFPTTRSVSQHAHPDLAEAVAISRFWRMVERRSPNECWPWLGDTSKGYGVFCYGGERFGAHELALSFTTGEKRLDSLETCHACDNPICCNPGHLRFDTRQSNVDDMHNRGRAPRAGKLSDADIIAIRERRAAGARQKDLAGQYGVTDGQISMIVRGLRWAHVGGPIQNERKYIRKAG
ncbi:hypothetical protein [Prescottella equi]|uniref:hypothetical protein n=1 Tax=Rhodococcus hoagii TaxID=43767 RepID=UPI001585AF0F|nr:hypothetical protein [Prescottella equi]